MIEHAAKTEWMGLRGRIGGMLLKSRLRRLFEILLTGDWKPLFMNRMGELIKSGNEVILDIGAGSGYISVPLAGMLKSGKVISLDLSEEMLSHLKRYAEKKSVSGSIEILIADAASTGLSDNSVDAAVTSTVFHELPDPEAALSEVFRVLKPGGSMILVDFTSLHGKQSKKHHGAFSPDEIQNYFKKAGFMDISATKIKHMVICEGRK